MRSSAKRRERLAASVGMSQKCPIPEVEDSIRAKAERQRRSS
jgi:hypothetical protein